MIDYLEDLLEEEAAVELTGQPLVPVGKRKVSRWEEEEDFLRRGRDLDGEIPAEEKEPREGNGPTRPGRPSWVEETLPRRSGSAQLLSALVRAGQMAGGIRWGKLMTVTLTGENPRSGQMDLAAMDRAVQRDARRYDGGFPLY